jgi:REP element-mobilizing transposase RayT
MARPLRVDIADGWYHITARGTDRRTIFTERREREHFLELLEALVNRYGVRLHGYGSCATTVGVRTGFMPATRRRPAG